MHPLESALTSVQICEIRGRQRLSKQSVGGHKKNIEKNMIILVISIIALGIIAALIAKLSKHDGEEKITVVETCATCNGTNDKCEQDCMMEAATKDIVYYDDEELDVFKGRPSDSYTDEEVEQFSEVLYTMRHEEIADWCRSLTLRGISLPNQIKDETFMLMEG